MAKTSAAVDTSGLSAKSAPLAQDGQQPEEVEGSYLKSLLLPILLPMIHHSSFTHVPTFQRICGVRAVAKEKDGMELTQQGAGSTEITPDTVEIGEAWGDPTQPIMLRVINFFLSVYFHFGAFMGCEAFYITMFPYVFWNLDHGLARRVMTMWGISMYLGQYLKDHLQLPRPYTVNKAVRSLEMDWVAEYGFPSTHTTAILGQAAMIIYYTHKVDYEGKNDYPLGLAIGLAAFAVISTVAGRVYLGVHSLPDLAGGVVVAVVLFLALVALEDPIDRFLMTSPHSLWVPPVMSILLLLAYPRLKHWSPSVGDTAVILGACNGMWMASRFARGPELPLDWRTMPALSWFMLSTARLVVGAATVAVARIIVKYGMRFLLLLALGETNEPAQKRYAIDVPTKFVCYSAVSITTIIVAPYAFDYLALDARAL
eukprot:m.14749 g.14749  ORF g.14749 m.14749 type:complete len:427 (+) comp7690_c0_seq1:59-1339(+)